MTVNGANWRTKKCRVHLKNWLPLMNKLINYVYFGAKNVLQPMEIMDQTAPDRAIRYTDNCYCSNIDSSLHKQWVQEVWSRHIGCWWLCSTGSTHLCMANYSTRSSLYKAFPAKTHYKVSKYCVNKLSVCVAVFNWIMHKIMLI